jgi:branched-chain amino acid transport system permease protein
MRLPCPQAGGWGGGGESGYFMSLFAFFVTQSANALSQAALLFFLGVGLTLIFGIMRIVNFAHGTFYMLGAFIGYSAARLTGSFWIALVVAPVAVGAVGALFELGILRRLYRRDASAFLMVTFGLALVLGELIRLLWGPEALQVEPPSAFSGIVFLMGEPFPTYRLFLAGAGVLLALALWQFLDRTRLGLLRATSQNAEMVHALGTDVGLVRSAVFGIGCGLAGIGGVLAAPLVTASIGMAAEMIIDAFVIVIIGGMGSFPGSLIAAVVVAFVQVFGEYYLPDLALAFMYLVMLLVLVVRPGGLMGKEA